MKDHQEEYKSVFIAEAEGHLEEIDRLLTVLEKEPEVSEHIHALFRITHTLKGNAESMGYKDVAGMAHVMEDLFGLLREQTLKLQPDQFNSLFRASDVLNKLVMSIKTGEKVSYRGIKTKLQVLTRKLQEQYGGQAQLAPETAAPAPKPEAPIAATPPPDPAVESPKAEETPEPQIGPEPEKAEEPPVALPTSELATEPTSVAEEPSGPSVSWSNKDLVQVPVHKLDDLLNLVGELVIERDRILATHGLTAGTNEFSRLNRLTSDLQYGVMDVRLVQVGFLFNKFHRTVRDAANLEEKKVRLMLEGTDTEIDRNVLQTLSDSLTHLIRNAVAHGIESPEERQEQGKPEEGTIILSARADNDAVLIDIRDDGGGIPIKKVRERAQKQGLISAEMARQLKDEDMVMYIFEPGFSTAQQVSSLSGRGVGMDVVKRAVEAVGGTIRVTTEAGQGTIVHLRVPASMAVKGTLLCQLDQTEYAIPLIYTEAVLSIYATEFNELGGRLVTRYLGDPVPVIFLKDLFSQEKDQTDRRSFYTSFHRLHPEKKIDLVVVECHGRRVALVVDKLLQQKEIVEKPLAKPVAEVSYISGVTILGSGRVCLVLNVVSITNQFFMAAMMESTKPQRP